MVLGVAVVVAVAVEVVVIVEVVLKGNLKLFFDGRNGHVLNLQPSIRFGT